MLGRPRAGGPLNPSFHPLPPASPPGTFHLPSPPFSPHHRPPSTPLHLHRSERPPPPRPPPRRASPAHRPRRRSGDADPESPRGKHRRCRHPAWSADKGRDRGSADAPDRGVFWGEGAGTGSERRSRGGPGPVETRTAIEHRGGSRERARCNADERVRRVETHSGWCPAGLGAEGAHQHGHLVAEQQRILGGTPPHRAGCPHSPRGPDGVQRRDDEPERATDACGRETRRARRPPASGRAGGSRARGKGWRGAGRAGPSGTPQVGNHQKFRAPGGSRRRGRRRRGEHNGATKGETPAATVVQRRRPSRAGVERG